MAATMAQSPKDWTVQSCTEFHHTLAMSLLLCWRAQVSLLYWTQRVGAVPSHEEQPDVHKVSSQGKQLPKTE